MSNPYSRPTILSIFNSQSFPSNSDFLTVQDGNKYLVKNNGVVNNVKVNSIGSNINVLQYFRWERLIATSISAGTSVNFNVSFPTALPDNAPLVSNPRVFLTNSSYVAQGSIVALNFLLMTCQTITRTGFNINITNTHPSAGFNDFLSADIFVIRDN